MIRTPNAPVTPAVLRWARLAAGVSRDDLARRAGVTAGRVEAWENGDELPSLAKLRAVADGLRLPVAFFFTPEPPERAPERPPDFRGGTGTLSAPLLRELTAAQERRDAYQEFGVPPTWRDDLPTDPDAARTRLGVTVEDIADATDPTAALHRWIAAVEDLGILVFQMSGIPVAECRGFVVDDDEVPVIVLNGADAPQARAFTLMHELGHLAHHTGGLCDLDEHDEAERECNRFAAAVLMPRDAVATAIRGAEGRNAVQRVARQFRVSPMAAALRLLELRKVARSVVDQVQDETEAAAARAAENPTGGGPAPEVLKRRNLGDPYIATVLDALGREAITVVDAAYLLDAKVAMVDKLERRLAGEPA